MNIYGKKILSAVAITAFAPVVLANGIDYIQKPYVGFEVIQTNQQYKAGYGDNLFKKNPQNYSFFAGFNFWKALGLELGYEFQPSRSKYNISIPIGSVIAGGNPTEAGTMVFNSYIENQNPYLGLFADTDKKVGSGKLNFKALVGFSVTTVKSNYTVTKNVDDQVNTPRDFKKTKAVFMAKLASSYIFANNVGIRLSLNYRNMSAFKINAKQAPARQIQLKDMFGIGLGLTYSFC